MRKRARLDVNQADIVKELRARGVTVQSLATIGDGCPDILCGWRGKNYLFEIKSTEKKELTANEIGWAMNWRGSCRIAYTWQQAWAEMQ